MAKYQRSLTEEPSVFDNPWLRHQVETHLFFGFFARRCSFGWALVVVVALAVLLALAEPWPVLLGRTVTAGIMLAVFVPLLRMSRYHQAALGWWVVKATIAMASFVTLFVGGLVGFFQGQPDAIYLTVLALVWFPGLEFHPALVDRQRFITLGRLTLSIPIVALGSYVGDWKW